MLDIGDNTHCAASALLRGDNPYRLRCQRTEIVHEPSRGVVRRADGAVTLRGVPYRYGYPYFPLMAAAFVPATAFLDGVASLRATLLAALAATLLASAVLVRALRPPGSRTLAFTAAWAALLCNPVLGFQLFEECSTDLVIAPLLLLAFAAHERRRYALAGVLAAASFGMKLFPGALVLAESWHPDWEVTVDGRARAPVEAHLVGQAVRIEPGRHLVRWRFRGTSLRRGVAVSLTALGLLLAIAAAARSRRPS